MFADSSIVQQCVDADYHIYHLINYHLSNSFFNWVMPILRNSMTWIPLYLLIFIFALIRYRKQGLLLIVMLASVLGATDAINARIIKKSIKRIRPCHEQTALLGRVIKRVPCGSGYSFPSSHASNHFAIAVFLGIVFNIKNKVYCLWIWLAAILWAMSICFAQVYVGVHYPSDVLAGALFGSLMGTLSGLSFKRLAQAF